MKNILIIMPGIRPGGGPSGYTYNLMQGISQIIERDGPVNVKFYGFRSEERVLSVQGRGSQLRDKMGAIINSLDEWGVGIPRLLLDYVRAKLFLHPRTLLDAMMWAQVVIFQGYQPPRILRLAKLKDKIIVYMPHSPTIMADEIAMNIAENGAHISKLKYRSMLRNERYFFEYAKHIVFATRSASEPYVKEYGDILERKEISYILSGVDIDFIGSNPASDFGNTRTYMVAFIGRYSKHKGYDLFCEAAEIVTTRRNDVDFISAGTGPLSRTSSCVKDLGWRSDIGAVMCKADVIVVPNRVTYFDLLPIECAALGKPLVLTATGGNKELAAMLPDTVTTPVASSVAIADGICSCLKELEQNVNYGSRNRAIYESMFTSVAFAERWMSFFSHL